MTRPLKEGGASVREMKAAALDALVKQELAKSQSATASKMARLKAWRLSNRPEIAPAAPKAKRAK